MRHQHRCPIRTHFETDGILEHIVNYARIVYTTPIGQLMGALRWDAGWVSITNASTTALHPQTDSHRHRLDTVL